MLLQQTYSQYLKHLSPRIAVKQMSHFMQSYLNGNFETFDQRWKNKSAKAPIAYNLKNVKVPTYLIFAERDAIIGKAVNDKLIFETFSIHSYKSLFYFFSGCHTTSSYFTKRQTISSFINL
jgi:hypothetical protein